MAQNMSLTELIQLIIFGTCLILLAWIIMEQINKRIYGENYGKDIKISRKAGNKLI